MIDTSKLLEILNGCEGIVPGDWKAIKTGGHATARLVVSNDNQTVSVAWFGHGQNEMAGKTAEHIARLDSNTVKSIILELLSYRVKDKI